MTIKNRSPWQLINFLVLLFTNFLLLGCGARNNGNSPQAAADGTLPSIIVTPTTAHIQLGTTLQFSANVVARPQEGSPREPRIDFPKLEPRPKPDIIWSVNGVAGGNLLVGKIDAQGLYTAPPSLPTPHNITVTATSNGPSGSALVMLYGGGSGHPSGHPTTQLAVVPAMMNFGNVRVGSSVSQTGTLTAGNSSVTVYTADWNGSGFSLGGISFPLTIPAGQTASFTVTFAPQFSGSTPGTISFLSNAANSPATEELAGSGLQTAQHSVSLSWNSSTADQGYYVYRGQQSGGPYARISSLLPGTSYTDSAVTAGQTYYYVVTALGTNSMESGYSSPVQAVIPSP